MVSANNWITSSLKYESYDQSNINVPDKPSTSSTEKKKKSGQRQLAFVFSLKVYTLYGSTNSFIFIKKNICENTLFFFFFKDFSGFFLRLTYF